MSGFWIGGAAAYADGLHDEFHQRAEALREKLEQLDDHAARQALFDQIEELQRELRQKIDDIDRSLF